MAENLTRAQRERQREIMRCLIEEPKAYDRLVWWPYGELVARAQIVTDCSPQAATGALQSLIACGLVLRLPWLKNGQAWCRASDAAFRAAALASPGEGQDE